MQKLDTGTVKRLARRIEHASARGDLDGFKRLRSRMIDIAAGSPETSEDAPTLRMDVRAAVMISMRGASLSLE